MFLSGTLLNVATVLVGTTLGVLAGSRIPRRLQESLTTGLGLFTLVLAIGLGLRLFAADVPPGHDIAVLAAILAGAAVGELARIHDGLEWIGGWFQRRLAREGEPNRIAEGFLTASLVFCVGPLTILGSLDNGLRGDVTLLSIKSLLDGVASVAFAAALGPGVYLSVATILVIQGTIAGGAFLLADALDPATVTVITATGGIILVGIALRLLEIRAVRVANFLPALVLAPLLVRVADAVRGLIG